MGPQHSGPFLLRRVATPNPADFRHFPRAPDGPLQQGMRHGGPKGRFRGKAAAEPRRTITEAKLFEGSIVWMPANPLASIDRVTSTTHGLLDRTRGRLAPEEFDPRNIRHLDTLLRDAGIRRLQPESHYGLTVALGSAEVSPEEIGTLYAMLANRGMLRPLRRSLDDPELPFDRPQFHRPVPKELRPFPPPH